MKYDEEKNQIKGTLKKTLPFKNGLTCYSDLGDGYFTAKHEIGADRWIFRLSIGVLVITAVLFVLFGRDEKIIHRFNISRHKEWTVRLSDMLWTVPWMIRMLFP